MEKRIITNWIVTSEGNKKTFGSEEELNKYIEKTRPANDEAFTIEKVTTEYYSVPSKFPKRIINTQLILDVMHYLGDCLIDKNFRSNALKYDIRVDWRWQKYVKNQHEGFDAINIFIGKILKNATIDNVINEFVFNQCDLKGCHNYCITYASKEWIEYCNRIKEICVDDHKEWRKLRDQIDSEYNKDDLFRFEIQFRTEGNEKNWDIVFGGGNCWGRKTRCIISKKLSFGEDEKKKFIEFINYLIEK